MIVKPHIKILFCLVLFLILWNCSEYNAEERKILYTTFYILSEDKAITNEEISEVESWLDYTNRLLKPYIPLVVQMKEVKRISEASPFESITMREQGREIVEQLRLERNNNDSVIVLIMNSKTENFGFAVQEKASLVVFLENAVSRQDNLNKMLFCHELLHILGCYDLKTVSCIMNWEHSIDEKYYLLDKVRISELSIQFLISSWQYFKSNENTIIDVESIQLFHLEQYSILIDLYEKYYNELKEPWVGRILAKSYYKTKQYQKVIELIEPLEVNRDPLDYLYLANSYTQLLRFPDAIKYFEQYFEMEENPTANAYQNLSILYLSQVSKNNLNDENLKRASKLLQEGVKKYPNNGAINKYLGALYLITGQREKAAPYLNAAKRLGADMSAPIVFKDDKLTLDW